MRRMLIVAMVTALATTASADVPADNAAADPHDWGIGLMVSVLSHPGGHLGIPLPDGTALATTLYAHYQLRPRWLVTAGLGTPSGLGAAIWIGVEPTLRLWASDNKSTTLELYVNPAAQLGFAGPDYYANHDNEFVGYAYSYSGPLTVAVRLPIGVRLRWLHDRFETSVELLEMPCFTPTIENIVAAQLGAGVRF